MSNTWTGWKLFVCTLALCFVVGSCGDDGSSSSPLSDVADLGPDDTGTDADVGDADVVDEDVAVAIPEGCNPLAFQHDCLLPFPSDFFVRGDDDERRVSLTPAASILTDSGELIDVTALHPAQGFSVHPTILAHWPEGLRDDELAFHEGDAPLTTLHISSSTLLIEADTGQLVMHFAELDPRADEPADQALMIRPMVRLRDETRYVVALKGLRNRSGELVAAPRGFRELRDGSARDSALTELAPRYEREVFAVLDELGVDRGDLQLAWDFTTRSRADAAGDLLAIRDDVLARIDASPPTIVLEEPERNDELATRIFRGFMTVPSYVQGNEGEQTVCRDAIGVPVVCGSRDVPFSVIVPDTVWDDPTARPARVVQFGHGFFGSRAEAEGDLAARFVNHTKTVMVGVDWFGMSGDDIMAVVADVAFEPAVALRFLDRLNQAFANQLALTAVISTSLADALRIDDQPVYAAQPVYYYGLSNGHILGGTFVALSPAIDTAVMGVGGAAYSLIMFRSLNFLGFEIVLREQIASKLTQQKWASMSQLAFDRIDPITYAPWLADERLPNTPATRRILFHTGLGDASVPFVSAHLHARATDVPLLTPAVRPVVGIDEVPYPAERGLVEFDFGLPDPLPGTLADFPDGTNDVHEGIRQTEAAMDQIDRFFTPGGVIEQTCQGACDPE